MNIFRRILKQKWCSRSRMRGVNTHNRFQTLGPLEQELHAG